MYRWAAEGVGPYNHSIRPCVSVPKHSKTAAGRARLFLRRGILFSSPHNLAAMLLKQRLFVIVPRGGDFLF